jgi:hypothetical protein
VERPDLKLVVINAYLVPNEPAAAIAMLAEIGLTAADGDGFVERLFVGRPRDRDGGPPRSYQADAPLVLLPNRQLGVDGR